MNSGSDKKTRRGYVLGVLGLGLIFSVVWGVMLAVVPPNNVINILNYFLYFMSLSVIALPTYGLILLFWNRRIYAILVTALIWGFWVFGVRTLVTLLVNSMAGM